MTYWIVTSRWTARVTVNDRGVITAAAPLVRKFRGQPFSNLLGWAKQSGLVAVEEVAC